MSRLTVGPAYGRDYHNKAQIEADWEAGKDFVVLDVSSRWYGSYINREDAERAGIQRVNVRYQQNRKMHSFKVAAEEAPVSDSLQSTLLRVADELPQGDPTRRRILDAVAKDAAADPYDVVREIIDLGSRYMTENLARPVERMIDGVEEASKQAEQGDRRLPGGMVGDRVAIAHLKGTLIPQLEKLAETVNGMLAESKRLSGQIKGY
jgi:hypothetical protein